MENELFFLHWPATGAWFAGLDESEEDEPGQVGLIWARSKELAAEMIHPMTLKNALIVQSEAA